MMDLELPPPGLQSQQVLLRPSGLSAVPREWAGARGEGSSGGRDSLNPDYDGRAGKATGDVGTATGVGTEPEVPKGAVGPGTTTTSLGRLLRGGGRGWTLAVLAGAARPFPGLRGFPESVPVKMCLVTGPRSGELRSLRLPPRSPSASATSSAVA